jgi:hypothetical protein
MMEVMSSALMTWKKTWEDQPDEVVSHRILLSSCVGGGRLVEVRHNRGGPYYITAGNLFGSQTVRCFEEELAWQVVDIATHSRPTQKPPVGVEIVE